MKRIWTTAIVLLGIIATRSRADAQAPLGTQLGLCSQPVGTWNGAKIVGAACDPRNPLQTWTAYYVGDAYTWHYYAFYNVGAQKCLDNTDGNSTDGTQVQIWECNPASPTSTTMYWGLAYSYPGDPAFRYHQLVNLRTGKCLDQRAAGTAPGTVTQIYHCAYYLSGTTTPNQAQFWSTY